MNWFELTGIVVWMAIVVLMIIGADESEEQENT